MAQKIDPHVFSGLQQDLDPYKLASEFLVEAKNVRISGKADKTNMAITPEKGTTSLPIVMYNFEKIKGQYIGHIKMGEYLILFTHVKGKLGDKIDNDGEKVPLQATLAGFKNDDGFKEDYDTIWKVNWKTKDDIPGSEIIGIKSIVNNRTNVELYTANSFEGNEGSLAFFYELIADNKVKYYVSFPNPSGKTEKELLENSFIFNNNFEKVYVKKWERKSLRDLGWSFKNSTPTYPGDIYSGDTKLYTTEPYGEYLIFINSAGRGEYFYKLNDGILCDLNEVPIEWSLKHPSGQYEYEAEQTEINGVDRIYRFRKDKKEVLGDESDVFKVDLLFQGNLNFKAENPLTVQGSVKSSLEYRIYWVDGINPLRTINILEDMKLRNGIFWDSSTSAYVLRVRKSIYKESNSGEISRILDVMQDMNLEEKVETSYSAMGGLFPAGTNQYIATYTSNSGKETNPFWVSPIYYTGLSYRACKPGELAQGSFEIKVANIDTKFRYLNLYSLSRTEYNGVVSVRKVSTIDCLSNLLEASYDPKGTIDCTAGLYAIANTDFQGTLIIPSVFRISDSNISILKEVYKGSTEIKWPIKGNSVLYELTVGTLNTDGEYGRFINQIRWRKYNTNGNLTEYTISNFKEAGYFYLVLPEINDLKTPTKCFFRNLSNDETIEVEYTTKPIDYNIDVDTLILKPEYNNIEVTVDPKGTAQTFRSITEAINNGIIKNVEILTPNDLLSLNEFPVYPTDSYYKIPRKDNINLTLKYTEINKSHLITWADEDTDNAYFYISVGTNEYIYGYNNSNVIIHRDSIRDSEVQTPYKKSDEDVIVRVTTEKCYSYPINTNKSFIYLNRPVGWYIDTFNRKYANQIKFRTEVFNMLEDNVNLGSNTPYGLENATFGELIGGGSRERDVGGTSWGWKRIYNGISTYERLDTNPEYYAKIAWDLKYIHYYKMKYLEADLFKNNNVDLKPNKTGFIGNPTKFTEDTYSGLPSYPEDSTYGIFEDDDYYKVPAEFHYLYERSLVPTDKAYYFYELGEPVYWIESDDYTKRYWDDYTKNDEDYGKGSAMKIVQIDNDRVDVITLRGRDLTAEEYGDRDREGQLLISNKPFSKLGNNSPNDNGDSSSSFQTDLGDTSRGYPAGIYVSGVDKETGLYSYILDYYEKDSNGEFIKSIANNMIQTSVELNPTSPPGGTSSESIIPTMIIQVGSYDDVENPDVFNYDKEIVVDWADLGDLTHLDKNIVRVSSDKKSIYCSLADTRIIIEDGTSKNNVIAYFSAKNTISDANGRLRYEYVIHRHEEIFKIKSANFKNAHWLYAVETIHKNHGEVEYTDIFSKHNSDNIGWNINPNTSISINGNKNNGLLKWITQDASAYLHKPGNVREYIYYPNINNRDSELENPSRVWLEVNHYTIDDYNNNKIPELSSWYKYGVYNEYYVEPTNIMSRSIKPLMLKSVINEPTSTNFIRIIDNGMSGEEIPISNILSVKDKLVGGKDIALFKNSLFLLGAYSVFPKLSGIRYWDIKTQISNLKSVAFDGKAVYSSNLLYQGVKGLISSAAFKVYNTYRLGFQLQDRGGLWTEPYFLSDYTVSPDENNIVSELNTINLELNLNTLKGLNYKKIRPVVCFADPLERKVIEQGILCPTLYSEEYREKNAPYAMSSWFFRNINGWGNFVKDEIQGGDSYKKDTKFITLHNSFLKDSVVPDNTKLTNFVSLGISMSSRHEMSIQTETPPFSTKAQGFTYPTGEGNMRVSDFVYEDSIVSNKGTESWADMIEGKYNSVYFAVYPWHRKGSLNNDCTRGETLGNRSAVLKKKILANFVDFSLRTRENLEYKVIDSGVWRDIDGVPIRLKKSSDEPASMLYYGEVNTVYLPNEEYHIRFRPIGTVLQQRDYFHWLDKRNKQNFINSLFSGDISNKWPSDINQVFSTGYSGVTDGTHLPGLVSSKESIPIKYKSDPHIVLYLNDYINKLSPLRADLIRTTTPTFGGVTDEALKANLWYIGGDAISIKGDNGDYNVNLVWDRGDCFYGEQEILKTYEFAKDDVNTIVEIGRCKIASFKNPAGRYDNNVNGNNMLYVSPSNFNLFNNVYNQLDNLFVYQKLDNVEEEDSLRNQQTIRWSEDTPYYINIDNMQSFPVNQELNINIESGEGTAINTNGEDLLLYQTEGISKLMYKEKSMVTSSNGSDIALGATSPSELTQYLVYKNTGVGNKSFICSRSNDIYYIDILTKHLMCIANGGQLIDISLKNYMISWFKDNYDNIKGMCYDNYTKDVIIYTDTESLVYSEILGQFVGLFDYKGIKTIIGEGEYEMAIVEKAETLKANKTINEEYQDINNKAITKPAEDYITFWKMHSSEEICNFFGEYNNYKISFYSNLEAAKTKCFTNLSIRADWRNLADLADGTGVSNNLFFDTIRVSNEYQDSGIVPIKLSRGEASAIRKFRVWRMQLPRVNHVHDDNNIYPGRRDRFYNPWIKIELTKNVNEDNQTPGIIHDLDVTYYD